MQELQNVVNLLQSKNFNLDIHWVIDYYSLTIIIFAIIWIYLFYKLIPQLINFIKKIKKEEGIGFKLLGKHIGFK